MLSTKLARSLTARAGTSAVAARSLLVGFAKPTATITRSSAPFFSAAASATSAAFSRPVKAVNWKIDVLPAVPPPGNMPELRVRAAKETDRLAEVVHAKAFAKWLAEQPSTADPEAMARLAESGLNHDDIKVALKAAMMTLLLHTESRVASAVGQGYYTIGPCGEELMGAIALAVRDTDALALHYRHLAVQLVRQLKAGRSDAAILLDRARAHTVAASDPVTGGAHCAIGGGDYDFLVTSTLASQACPAVGRAMGNGLAQFMASTTPDFKPLFEKDMVSFVSLGDGSVNNAHFLSAVNLAEYAAFRKFKCPAVFAVSDNDLSISLRGYGYLSKQWLKGLQMPLFTAKGDDFLSIYAATKQAVDSARSKSAPAFLYINNIARRFGHAATDRQAAYLTPAEITKLAATNPVEKICQLAAGAGVVSFAEQAALFEQLWESTRAAFNDAAAEPKISSRADMLARVSIPLAPLPAAAAAAEGVTGATGTAAEYAGSASAAGHFPAGLEPLVDRSAFQNVQTRVTGKLQAPRVDAGLEAVPANPETRDVMRKHMTKVFDELMATYPNMAYLGEDVVHGGYYLVTEGLAAKYPHRVRDFPPDETSLIGAGIGFAQTGLLPVVEIPYAKYLDCGADMFYEAALSSWLSNTKQPNGMIVRLQGFGKGVFGGNFHTHNTLYMPPGIDVVCYSNGADYAMGMRYATLQASRGRVVMSVDSTHLLNLRHVDVDDDGWRKPYTDAQQYLDFDQVRVYAPAGTAPAGASKARRIALITYGEGVVTSLQTRKKLHEHGILADAACELTIIDCPLLSRVPQGLRDTLTASQFDGVVFADPCKEGQNPLAGHIAKLHQEGLLPAQWQSVGAQVTYNPLGSTLTFLSPEDITATIAKLF